MKTLYNFFPEYSVLVPATEYSSLLDMRISSITSFQQ